ncbi:MAG TPA: hypothetical protein VGR43_02625 [Dehalococcoidia bacterium]|jgi:hypothetical protein|nr:hypothetical protein [Dehalococcoidia bacterium]
MSDGEPTLKYVIAWSDERNLCTLVEAKLQARTGANDVLRLGDDGFVVHSADEPAAIRDSISGVLRDGESVLVFEFERWSGFGQGIDARWLMKRGH